jgi:hypothetical protein
MPGHESFGSNDRGDLTPETIALGCQPSALVVVKPKPLLADLLGENAILLPEIIRACNWR